MNSIFISVGDQSGQAHALKIIKILQQQNSSVKIYGFGGDKMSEAGVEIIQPLADLNIMGFKDVFLRLPLFFKAIFNFKRTIDERKPDLVLLIDYPGLNKHLLRIAKRQHIKVANYIVPQLWAWAPWRLRDFKAADALFCILPFESAWYRKHGATAHYVGHPIADELPAIKQRLDSPIIAILPGSRKREIATNLPLMLRAAKLLQQEHPHLRFILPHSRPQLETLIMDIISQYQIDVELSFDGWHQHLARARAAWVVSGTASLEVAALGIPGVVVYQINSRIGAWLASNALAVPYIGGINLIAGKELLPEIMGCQLDAADLVTAIEPFLDDEHYLNTQSQLQQIRSTYLRPEVSSRVAKFINNIEPNITRGR